jgi:hypothetical protein
MNQPTNDSREPINLILTPDEFAVLLLNTYQGGAYAYEEGETKTDSQKYQKRVLKEEITQLLAENDSGSLKKLLNAMIEALFHIEEPTRLRQENKLLRAYKKEKDNKEENREANEKVNLRALLADDVKQEFREEIRAESKDKVESLLRNNARYRKHIEKLEKQGDHYKRNMISKDAYNILKAENEELSEQMYEIQTKNKKKSKQLAIEKLQEQLADDTISSD